MRSAPAFSTPTATTTAARERLRRRNQRNSFPSMGSSSQSTRPIIASSLSSSLILSSLLLFFPSSSPQVASSLLFSPQQRCHQRNNHYNPQHQPWRRRHRQHEYSNMPFSSLPYRTCFTAGRSRSVDYDEDDDNDNGEVNETDSPSIAFQKKARGRLSTSEGVNTEKRELSFKAKTITTRKSTRKSTSTTTAAAKSAKNSSKYYKPTTISTNHHNIKNSNRATMSTALCIVPPHHAWDAIQRARHMARDASFYRWPPAIRLFHPFVPPREMPNAAGRLASWIDSVCEEKEVGDDEVEEGRLNYASGINEDDPSAYLRPFEVTLDSILILPHWEILDARIEALEDGSRNGGFGDARSHRGEEQRRPQRQRRKRQEQFSPDNNNDYYRDDNDGNSADASAGGSQEVEYRRRKAQGARLIEDEERKGIARKKERERKQRIRLLGMEGGNGTDIDSIDTTVNNEDSLTPSLPEGDNDVDNGEKSKNSSSYNGPCVVYLSPDDASRHRLESLREKLRVELFPNYDAFSPGSSVSPYPECLPRPRSSGDGVGEGIIPQFRPLLPIGRFATVEDAVTVAKFLQSTWDPLTFNVTDIQFISRRVDANNDCEYTDPSSSVSISITASSSERTSNVVNSNLFSGGTGFGRSSSMKSITKTTSSSVHRMAITTSGEVEDVSRQGIYGCDAMVMLLGEEPEEELMDSEASLAMMMIDDDDDNVGEIDYDKIFATAEREYRRMQTHEILTTKSPLPSTSYLDENNSQGDESDEYTSDIEAWLDDDDESLEDLGATVVIGRAQFFMGANREFVGMPASSAIDSKDRIMGGGTSAVARRKGSVHRLAESWSAGDYGKKESDRRG